MAVINDPNIAANIQRVGSVSWMPAHVTSGPFPVGAGGAFKLSMHSGTMAAALAANSEIFQFRYVTGQSRKALVYGVSISMTILTLPGASTTVASGPYQFRATVARSWTAAGSGGTRAVLTGNNQKLATGHTTSEVNDIGISTTGLLTVGTKSLDSQDIGSVTASYQFATAVGAGKTNVLEKAALFGYFPRGDLGWPLELANQEGFVVRTGVAFPATMTWNFCIDVLWSEVDTF